MPDHVLEPGKVCVPGRRNAVGPAHVLLQLVRAPVGEIERRICHDKVGLELRVAVIKEGVCAELAQIGVNAPDSKIHLSQLPCGGVGILTIDGNAVDIPAVVFDESRGLDKHTAAAAARIVDPPVEGELSA